MTPLIKEETTWCPTNKDILVKSEKIKFAIKLNICIVSLKIKKNVFNIVIYAWSCRGGLNGQKQN